MADGFHALEPAHAEARCPLCGAERTREVLQLHDVPAICNQLWPDAEAARAAARGDTDLVICEDCTLIFNSSFCEERVSYAPGYENALHFSPHFRAFADALCADLVSRYDLMGRDVVEIGCGDGHFLALMITHGARSATGFDPSAPTQATPLAATPGVEIFAQHFRHDQLDRSFDFLICRHVLEHLTSPMSVLREIRAAIGARSCFVYFEVPNTRWILESGSICDVIYEHVTYWTRTSLEVLFRRAGFEPVSIRSGYDDQFLMVEARPATCDPDYLPATDARTELARACRGFAQTAEKALSAWTSRLDALRRQGKRAVIWGAGSKGVTFANVVAAPQDCLIAMVDVNPRKHGRFIPGAALPVVSPAEIPKLAPDVVLVSNHVYAEGIRDMVTEQGLWPEFGVISS